MPANDAPTRAARGRIVGARLTRMLSGALMLSLLATAGPSAAAPAEATDWTRQIAATRGSQIYFEGVMRAADQQLRILKHAAKRAHRNLAKSRRNLRQAKLHHAQVKAERTEVETDLAAARAVLEGRDEELTPPTGAPVSGPLPSVLSRPALPAGPDAADEADIRSNQGLDVAVASGHTPGAAGGVPAAPAAVDGVPAPGDGAAAAILGAWAAGTLAALTLAERMGPEIAALEDQAGQQQRALATSRHKLRRISRSYRAKARGVASVRRSTGAALARRAGSEASLAYSILAMSSLAQRRAAKKTDVRPGRDSAFVWPTQGRITQTYGCTGFHLEPPLGSCPHFHDGIDIAGYQGTPVRSAAVGIVSYIGWNPWDERQRAFMVVVAHPGGYETLYAHVLPTRNVRVGQLVRKGELIAYMGRTGRATGVHLHLELRRGRTTMNPLAFL